MAVRLPPLTTLRAFKVAAQCLSFTETANELNITQAAVSHQIKALEEFFDKPLFKRGNRSLALTETGARFLPYIDQMFTVLEQGTDEVTQEDDSPTLTVSVIPSFAARWLVPRLGLFFRTHPEIDFRLAPSRGLVNFNKENIDLAIRHGGGKYPGLYSIHLAKENIYPVCHPKLLEGKHALKKPSDLEHHVLLHDEGHGDWRAWLIAAKANNVDSNKGPVHNDSSMAIQQAAEGDGVALARSQLVKGDIACGVLVRPFKISQPSKFAYYIVYPENKAVTPQMEVFIKWLQDQMQQDEAKYGDS